jgi:hypothetical protein
MEEVSQVWNRVLGRNQDWAASKPWENAERSGWLMKQGNLRDKHVQALESLSLNININIASTLTVYSPLVFRRAPQNMASSVVCS